MNERLQKENLDIFIEALCAYEGLQVFNPWTQYDPRYDASLTAPAQRRSQLRDYLWPRLGRARHLILAEAIGYQGGRFTGIAMTCERMLLNHHKTVKAHHIFTAEVLVEKAEKGLSLRTSRSDSPFITKETQRKGGFNEPTDTVVWESILRNGWDPFDFLLWNIFPFHPHKPGEALSNRTPTGEELQVGWNYTKALLELMGGATLIAVGQKAATTVASFGYEAHGLRHPANGGARKYAEGFAALLGKGPLVTSSKMVYN